VRKFIVNHVLSLPIIPYRLRRILYQILGLKVSKSQFWSGVFFDSLDVEFGKRCFVNRNCTFSKGAKLGNNISIGRNLLMLSTNHDYSSPERRGGKASQLPSSIEDGCWIGAGVTILPGVIIKKGCVIASGAVVVKNCEPNGLYAGVPAKRIKDLPL